MRLKKDPMAVNMRVEVKDVVRPINASSANSLGWLDKWSASEGK